MDATAPTTGKSAGKPRLKRPRRHVSAATRERQPAATAPNELWSMNFVSDALFDGRRLRAVTVVDAFTREALAIHVDQGIKGEQVVDVMDRLLFERGSNRRIVRPQRLYELQSILISLRLMQLR